VKILHVVPSYLPAHRQGGPLRSVHGLARELAAAGHRVEVFTTSFDVAGRVSFAAAVDLDGVQVSYYPLAGPQRLYWAPALARELRRRIRDYDVVHLHSVFLWPTSAAARIAERAGVPYVLAPRGMLVPALLRQHGRWRKSVWLAARERRTIERAAALHATSAREAEDLAAFAAERGIALPAIEIVPNGVDEVVDPTGEVSPAVAAALATDRVALFLGRLSWKKGLDTLVEALSHAPGALLVLAGPDDESMRAQLESAAAGAGVGDRVCFLGHVDGADRAALLHRSRVLVLPSRNENFGNVVLEAMVCGTPVVVTEGVGLADEVRRSGAGVVAASSPGAIGAAIRTIFEASATERERMSSAGRAAAAGFGWPAIAKLTERLYSSVAKSSIPAPTAAARSSCAAVRP
jgi:glycosyltransferase involved in cell wall biosynthesis